MTQPKTDLAYLRNEKAKAEQKLRSCQHREKILEHRMSELNRRERVHRLCTRAGMLESFLVCPGELTDDQVMELLKISKINATFLTGQQIDRIHVQQLLLPSFMCQGAQRLLLYHVPSQKTIAFLTKDTHKNFPFQKYPDGVE